MTIDPPQAASPQLTSILVVEDDAAIRLTMVTLLQQEGYTVHGVEHGQEALDYLEKQNHPCLVFLDLQMPIMDGWTFLERFQKANHLAHIPVVVTSAIAETVNLTGVAAKLGKPFEIEAVLALARRYCGPGRVHGGS